jgi:hypothetical protein
MPGKDGKILVESGLQLLFVGLRLIEPGPFVAEARHRPLVQVIVKRHRAKPSRKDRDTHE